MRSMQIDARTNGHQSLQTQVLTFSNYRGADVDGLSDRASASLLFLTARVDLPRGKSSGITGSESCPYSA